VLGEKKGGFGIKEKEVIKRLIERFGMMKMLNLADFIGRNKGEENGLIKVCGILKEEGVIKLEEVMELLKDIT